MTILYAEDDSMTVMEVQENWRIMVMKLLSPTMAMKPWKNLLPVNPI